jgi:hypothetical protein
MSGGRQEEPMRRFTLYRKRDVSGVSGTGLVAYGVVFPDGVAVTRWNAKIAQTCVWASIGEVEHVHGHGGATEVVWLDDADGWPVGDVIDCESRVAYRIGEVGPELMP